MSNPIDQSLRLSSVETLGSRLKSRDNNFDAMRLLAAFAVIVSHAYPIAWGSIGNDSEPYLKLSGYCSIGEISVSIFFIVSGLLVARSFISDPNLMSFMKKRLLRILPGLMACVLFCMLIMGPIFTQWKLADYFKAKEFRDFSRNAILLPNHYDLPGVFEEFDDQRAAVNGSLWSLPLEFVMYVAVLGLGLAGLLKKNWACVFVVIASFVGWIVIEKLLHQPVPPAIIKKQQAWLEQGSRLSALFFAGTLMLLYKDSIALKFRYFAVCLLLMVLSWQTSIASICGIIGHAQWAPAPGNNFAGYYVFAAVLPYIVMYLAFARMGIFKPVLQSATKWGDFSYGVYLYGYPVEQMVCRTIGDRIPFWAFIGLSCLGTLVLAILSWHLVEKQFLRMKKHPTHIGAEKKQERMNHEKHESHEKDLKRVAV